MFNNIGFFQKTILSLGSFLLLVFLGMGSLVSYNQGLVMSGLLLQNAKTVVQAIAVSSRPEILTNNFIVLPNILHEGISSTDARYAYILDRDGICLAHTDSTKVGTRMSMVLIRAWLEKWKNSKDPANEPRFLIPESSEDQEVIEVIYPIRIDEIHTFYGFVNVALNKSFILRSKEKLQAIFFLIFLFSLFISLVVASVLAMQATGPIREIVQVARQITLGNFDVPETQPHFLEEKLLKQSLKQMAKTIQDQVQELKSSNQSLDRKVYELEILMSAAMVMNSKCYSNEVLEKIMDMAIESLHAEWGSLLLADERHQVLVPRIVRGQYLDTHKPIQMRYDQGLAGAAFTGKTAVISNCGYEDPRFSPIDTEREKRIRNLICVPLVVNDQAIGVINIVNRKEGDFAEADSRLLVSIASLMARSIENSQLYNLAITDGLTGLYIRRYFEDRLLEFCQQAKRYHLTFSLIYADIDFFKSVNDTYGHVVGDRVIQGVARHLLHEARDNIDLVARIGGEEFAMILPETDKQGAMIFANRVRVAVQNSLARETGIQERQITMSFGVATFHEDGQTSMELIESADEALYTSKEGGRNRVTPA